MGSVGRAGVGKRVLAADSRPHAPPCGKPVRGYDDFAAASRAHEVRALMLKCRLWWLATPNSLSTANGRRSARRSVRATYNVTGVKHSTGIASDTKPNTRRNQPSFTLSSRVGG